MGQSIKTLLAVEHGVRKKLQKWRGCVKQEESAVPVCPFSPEEGSAVTPMARSSSSGD